MQNLSSEQKDFIKAKVIYEKTKEMLRKKVQKIVKEKKIDPYSTNRKRLASI